VAFITVPLINKKPGRHFYPSFNKIQLKGGKALVQTDWQQAWGLIVSFVHKKALCTKKRDGITQKGG